MAISTRIWMIISVVVGAVAIATLALSVATDAWLYTTETTEFLEVNFTRKTTIKAQMGLWKVCKIEAGAKFCQAYGDLASEEAQADETQQTSFAIMEAIRVAALFPVCALVMITIGVIFGILGNVKQDFKTLLAAVVFILSGLTLAVGIIFYISAINDEVGHRSKVKDGKKFTYEYGWSFVFAGIAFIITEVTAVVFVTLYMQRNSSRDDLVRIIPGLEDKFEDEQNEGDEEQAGTSNPTIIL